MTRTRLRAEPLEDRLTPAAPFPEFVDPHPVAGNQFGSTALVLDTGNVVITAPFDDFNGADTGAVYLFGGATGYSSAPSAGPPRTTRSATAGWSRWAPGTSW